MRNGLPRVFYCLKLLDAVVDGIFQLVVRNFFFVWHCLGKCGNFIYSFNFIGPIQNLISSFCQGEH